MTQITEQLAAAAPVSDLRATESFHQRVVAGLEKETATPPWKLVMARLRDMPLKWRVVSPVAVVALVMVGIWIGPSPRTHVPVSPPVPAGVPGVAADAGDDFTPSLANYERAADHFPDQLDMLLARQGQTAAGSGPVYTAARMSLGF
jgi:hypothetical protein